LTDARDRRIGRKPTAMLGGTIRKTAERSGMTFGSASVLCELA